MAPARLRIWKGLFLGSLCSVHFPLVRWHIWIQHPRERAVVVVSHYRWTSFGKQGLGWRPRMSWRPPTTHSNPLSILSHWEALTPWLWVVRQSVLLSRLMWLTRNTERVTDGPLNGPEVVKRAKGPEQRAEVRWPCSITITSPLPLVLSSSLLHLPSLHLFLLLSFSCPFCHCWFSNSLRTQVPYLTGS